MEKENTKIHTFYPLQILSRGFKWDLDKFLRATSIYTIKSNLFLRYAMVILQVRWEND